MQMDNRLHIGRLLSLSLDTMRQALQGRGRSWRFAQERQRDDGWLDGIDFDLQPKRPGSTCSFGLVFITARFVQGDHIYAVAKCASSATWQSAQAEHD
jgi:hypothetical protein